MAREHGRILVSRWSDTDWRALLTDEQWLYDLLLTQANINNAGVLPLQVRKWARGSADMTEQRIEAALQGLTQKRYVFVDVSTEEVLVRSFIRNDGVAKHRYMLKNALTVAKQIESPALRKALAAELRRLGNPDADAVAGELEETPEGTPPECHSNGIQTAFGPPSNAHGEGEGEVALVPPRSTNVGTSVGRPRSQAKRGTRIPDDFAVSAEMVEWARAECPDVDGRRHTQKFINYWSARAGKEATKLDWVRTWKNWMLGEQEKAERAKPRAPNGVSPTDANIAAFAARHMSTSNPPNLLALPGGAS